MLEAQIYIKKHKMLEGSCRLPTGGSLPPLGGCKNITAWVHESHHALLSCAIISITSTA